MLHSEYSMTKSCSATVYGSLLVPPVIIPDLPITHVSLVSKWMSLASVPGSVGDGKYACP